MHIPLPCLTPSHGERKPLNYRPIKSSKSRLEWVACNGGGTLPGATDLEIQVKKERTSKEIAVCIPSSPLETVSLRDPSSDFRLRQWWKDYRHNIAVSYGAVGDIGPLFLVVEKREADSFANCHYVGDESQTNLKISGHVSNFANLTLGAGFSCQETGNFGFKDGAHFPGQKWTLFIRSAKITITVFRNLGRLMSQLWQLGPEL